jgi:endosialidase-like protein
MMTLNGSDGNVGIGTTSPNYKLEVGGDINAMGAVRSNGAALFSDLRFKKNISTLPNALSRIRELRGVTYYWKTDEFPERKFNNERQIGFIAQELETIFPELVSTGRDGYKGVDYARLTPVLVEAIKQQQTELENQQNEIKELREIISSLMSAMKTGSTSMGQLK